MIYYPFHSCFQKCILCDIKLIVIDKSYLLDFVNNPYLIDVIAKKDQLRDLVMG